MSTPRETDPLDPNTENVGVPVRDNLDDYVNSAEFDFSCFQKANELARALSSDDADSSDAPDSVSTATTAETATHQVSKLEAYFYYAGISPKGWPTLVWRDSTDVFEAPTGPDAYVRRMRLAHVPEDHEFGQNGLWENVRDWVVEFLKGDVSVSSVDFVRFTWRNKREDREIDSEEEGEAAGEDVEDGAEEDDEGDEDAYDSFAPIKRIEDGDQYFTNPTIWVGVLPETLTGPRAFELGQKIRAFLDELEVKKEVDIAFRESIAQSLVGNGPALYAPLESGDPLEEFIDSVSVTLSLPIAGRKTTMQGSLGPYFQHNDKLYAITARHNLFLANDGNAPYKYNASAPKRDVVVMGNPAFTNYQNSIQARIGNLNGTVKSLNRKIASLTERVRNGIGLPETQHLLDEHEAELKKTNRKISNLKRFFVTLSKKWSKLSDRVIGHIVWSPSIGVGVSPNRFTRNVCVVELYKPKFEHFIGNVLSLGPKYSEADLKALMYERIDAPSDFKYPNNGLLALGGMFTAEQVKNPNSLDSHGDRRTRHVLKNGFTTGTTVGTLTRFMSFVRKYFTAGTLESLELAIFPHENETGTFSKRGDSGAPVVSGIGELAGLLTSGTNKGTDGSDITFATLFQYIWDLVLEEFPGANLYCGDIPAFLAAAV